jgi:hypothetical protein
MSKQKRAREGTPLIMQFLGYWVTDAPEALDPFLVQTHARYNALEQALGPIKEAVHELQQDWQPRQFVYWQNVMGHLVPLRQALEACLLLFAKEQSSEACPIPMDMAALSLHCRHTLNSVESKIEEAGILLTSHSAAPPSLDEASLRQRQRCIQALRALCEEGQDVVTETRRELGKVQATVTGRPRVRQRTQANRSVVRAGGSEASHQEKKG